jgi:hypothetical protein
VVVDIGGLILGQQSKVIVELRAVKDRIDLEQQLPRAHLRAFRVIAPQQHAGHAGRYVRAVIRRKPADELTFKRHRLRLRLHHGNLRGRRRRRAFRAGGEHDQTQIRQRRALRT